MPISYLASSSAAFTSAIGAPHLSLSSLIALMFDGAVANSRKLKMLVTALICKLPCKVLGNIMVT